VTSSSSTKSSRGVRPLEIFAVSVGNSIEWFEIVVYGYFGALLAKLFFPSSDPGVALLSFFATFGITFLARPFGALWLGIYSDRRGRRNGLLASAFVMAAGCGLIAITPRYETIGLLAPVLLIVARCLQGFAVGGEFGSATAFLAEQDSTRRGYLASWQFASQSVSAVLATGLATLITSVLQEDDLARWGWRIPFLLGFLLMPYAIYLRNTLEETEVFQATRVDSTPLKTLWLHRRLHVVVSCGLLVFGTVGTYTVVFLSTYAIQRLSIPTQEVFLVGFATACLQVVAVPIFGHLSDRCRRTTIPLAAAAVALGATYPMFSWLVVDPTVTKLMIVQIWFGLLVAAYAAPLPALLSELFPPRIRTTGLSLTYSVTVAVFGGFAPFIEAWLSREMQDKAAPFLYVLAAALISWVAGWIAARSLSGRASIRIEGITETA